MKLLKYFVFVLVLPLSVGCIFPADAQLLGRYDSEKDQQQLNTNSLESIARSLEIQTAPQREKMERERQKMMAEQEAEEEQNQAECFRVLQLCRPPYGEGAMCDLFFNSPCHQYDDLDTKLSKNRAALHNLDCEEKRKACLGGGAQDFCRPYWAYCADYDHERRADPTWRGHIKLPQPPENISEMKLPDDFLPCNRGLAKTVFLFDKKNHFLAVGQILQSNVLNINNDVRGLRRFGRIKDDHGDIKPDKELKLEDRIFLKQVHAIGVLKKNNYVQQCGVAKPFWIFKDGGWNIGYFDQKKQELLRDNLENRAPDKLVHVSIH